YMDEQSLRGRTRYLSTPVSSYGQPRDDEGEDRLVIEANSARPARADHRSDAELALAAQEDPEAFVALYDRHVASIYRLCLSRLRHREAAEDATSEVFLKALEGIHGFRGGRFVAWLMVIARHTVVDAARRRTTP